ncbi:DUF4190 domain-containing protein [Tsukamurella spumae]|uniref:DUF4190 domain-containing protein n=1 Tax=Tsukamurella spumae TaxID=44753 RepID=A0A846X3J3_9ACTN|nr:DUF4190 domain-containing protein [Tsukamurella spumae]NKY18899.1 DUF4190 domain-containing protein [Tsukamurella spumae]
MDYISIALGWILVAAVAGYFIRRAAKKVGQRADSNSSPIGYAPDGQPVYQVVGYTPDGQPVTSDRVVGGRPYSPHTNSLAVVALVLGFVAGPLAIPVGHISRAQIRRTGEQGGGMALAGLVLGYLSVTALVATAVTFAILSNV